MLTPVELVAAKAFVDVTVGRLASELERRYKLWKSLKGETESLGNDLVMLAATMDDELKTWRHAPRTAVARAYSEEMRELTHDIEDCIERFLHRVTCKEGASWLRRAGHAVLTLRTRLKFTAEIKELKKRLQEAHSRIFSPPAAGGAQSSSTATASRAESAHPDNPVGIAEATENLLALLVEPTQFLVVAIVGFGGSGKTTLAREVYNSVDREAFPCRAWVAVHLLENSDANGILTEIHKQLLPGVEYSATSLTRYLEAMENRYLIVIDDIKMKDMMHWDTIRNTFKGNGRIIVTTAIQSIANRCSSFEETNTGRNCGYVYKMRTLGEEDSMKMALRGRRTPELVQGSAALLKKCDGLPLALASVAGQLSSASEPTGQFCAELCRNLGSYLECEDDEEPNFARLRGVLMDNYTSLSDYTVRTCLLYLGIFPVDHPLRRNVIIRRWLAEGYARSDPLGIDLKVADGNFNKFIDRSIIQPVDPSNNASVKTCKTHGVMHVFMLHKSMSNKFIVPFGARHKKVRHLFIHNNNGMHPRTTFNTDLSRVRSLTVMGKAGDAISDFHKYKLIRVLDLEGCTDVKDGHLRDICKLWNLKYLSLGPNITKLPKKIAQLKLLETLDVSKTKVDVLPVEVIGLPCLIHLIGKLKLQDPFGAEQLTEECKLETLAGFVTDGHQGFLQLMVHMKKLNKVKIWCDSDDTDTNNHLLEAIKKYIEAPLDVGDVRSLSIDFRGLPEGSLYALRELYNHSLQSENKYYLSSLKLHGILSTLPEFIPLLSCSLTELCLSSPTVTQELLSSLTEMRFLVYLKLIADHMQSFTVQGGKFKSLRRLRFVLHGTDPILPTIEDGAMPELVSLQLICEHLVGLSGIQIRCLKKLKELVVHPRVAEETRRAWEAAATNHPNRPNVLPIRSVDETTNEEPTVNRDKPASERTDTQQRLVDQKPKPSAMQTPRENIPSSTSSSSGLTGDDRSPTHYGSAKPALGDNIQQMENIGPITSYVGRERPSMQMENIAVQ